MNQIRKTRILLADDHSVVRSGFRALLTAQSDLEVIGEASDGRDAVEQTLALQPDVVVADYAPQRSYVGHDSIVVGKGAQVEGFPGFRTRVRPHSVTFAAAEWAAGLSSTAEKACAMAPLARA